MYYIIKSSYFWYGLKRGPLEILSDHLQASALRYLIIVIL